MNHLLDIGLGPYKRLEISTQYYMGDYKTLRGVYVYFTLVSKDINIPEGGYSPLYIEPNSEDNFKILYKEYKRYPTKAIKLLDLTLAGRLEELAALYMVNDKEAIYNIIKGL